MPERAADRERPQLLALVWLATAFLQNRRVSVNSSAATSGEASASPGVSVSVIACAGTVVTKATGNTKVRNVRMGTGKAVTGKRAAPNTPPNNSLAFCVFTNRKAVVDSASQMQ